MIKPDANRKRAAGSAGQLLAICAHALQVGPDGKDALRLVGALEAIQPSRADVVASLSATESAAATCRPPVREFLDGALPARSGTGQLQLALADLQERAKVASHSPVLVDSTGKTRAGRGLSVRCPRLHSCRISFCGGHSGNPTSARRSTASARDHRPALRRGLAWTELKAKPESYRDGYDMVTVFSFFKPSDARDQDTDCDRLLCAPFQIFRTGISNGAEWDKALM
jgi:hypothetical protein